MNNNTGHPTGTTIQGSTNNSTGNRPIVTSQPPDLIVHSTNAGNWQEHSFDSSIVTEGHYDASFESEVLNVGPVQNSNPQQSIAMSTMTSVDSSATGKSTIE